MKKVLIVVAGFLFFFCSCENVKPGENEVVEKKFREIDFYTVDNIKIFGDLYEVDKEAATILLFHQGGSNARGEYVSIIPRLVESGFNVLAIDQRVGGQIYGNYNRTIANIPDNSFDNNYGYCDAYNNLEEALNFVITSEYSGKKILWGSSYSAALAVRLAHERQEDVAGVLSFSPASGEPMKDCLASKYFENLEVPLLILRPPNEMERESVKEQFELAQQFNHQVYAAEFGVHGSSMLVEERVGNNVDANWEVVMSFLAEVGGK